VPWAAGHERAERAPRRDPEGAAAGAALGCRAVHVRPSDSRRFRPLKAPGWQPLGKSRKVVRMMPFGRFDCKEALDAALAGATERCFCFVWWLI